MDNSVFGKTLENIDLRLVIKLFTSFEKIGRKYGAVY